MQENKKILEEIKALVDLFTGEQKLYFQSLLSPIFLMIKNNGSFEASVGWVNRLKIMLSRGYALFHQKNSFPLNTISPNAICFYADELGILDQHIPVYRELLKKGKPVFFVVHKVSLYNALREKGIKSLFVFVNPLTRLKGRWQRPAVNKNLQHITEKQIEAIFSLIASNQELPQITKYIRKLISIKKPSSFMVGHDMNPSTRLVSLISKEHNIPSFCIQHGAIGGDGLWAGEHVVDHLFVFGKITKQNLLRSEIKSRIHVTGPPYLQTVIEKSRNQKEKHGSFIPAKNFDKRILVAFSGAGHGTSQKHLEKQIKAISRLTKKNEHAGFIIKLHPKDKKENYLELSGLPNVFVLKNEDLDIALSIFDWLQHCDAVITGASAVAMEAMILGVPVFTLDLMEEYKAVDVIKESVTLHARSIDQLQYLFDTWLVTPTAHSAVLERGQRFIKKYYTNIKEAPQRNAQELLKLTERVNPSTIQYH